MIGALAIREKRKVLKARSLSQESRVGSNSGINRQQSLHGPPRPHPSGTVNGTQALHVCVESGPAEQKEKKQPPRSNILRRRGGILYILSGLLFISAFIVCVPALLHTNKNLYIVSSSLILSGIGVLLFACCLTDDIGGKKAAKQTTDLANLNQSLDTITETSTTTNPGKTDRKNTLNPGNRTPSVLLTPQSSTECETLHQLSIDMEDLERVSNASAGSKKHSSERASSMEKLPPVRSPVMSRQSSLQSNLDQVPEGKQRDKGINVTEQRNKEVNVTEHHNISHKESLSDQMKNKGSSSTSENAKEAPDVLWIPSASHRTTSPRESRQEKTSPRESRQEGTSPRQSHQDKARGTLVQTESTESTRISCPSPSILPHVST